LGGKFPAAIILDDYGLDAAAKSFARSALALNGQVCSALARLIVSRRRRDEFVDAPASRFGKVTVGDPFGDSQMGPFEAGCRAAS
jgi:betaine-aldehyde dehydrogenase